MAPLPR